MKNNKAIVFGITGNWAFALGNVLLGLKKHSPDLKADIIVFYDTISLKNKAALRKIYPVKFVKYKFQGDSRNINNINIFNEISFSRYECFSLLKLYEKILWLDVDILIQKDVSGIFEYEKAPLAMFSTGKKKLKGDFTVDWLDGFNLEVDEYGSGTIIFSDTLKNAEEIKRWCYEKANQYAEVVSSPDQAILNLALQKFFLCVKNIDETYLYHPDFPNSEDASILHAYYGKKFWNGLKNKEWEANNQKWVALGGTPYDENWDFAARPDFFRQPSKFVKDFIKRYIA